MPVTIEWGNTEKTILHVKFLRPWNWDEYYGVYQEGYAMTESVDHKVNIIMDFSKNDGRLPASALTHFRSAASKAHPRRGVVIITSPRMMLVRTMVNMIQKIGLIKTPMLFANTVEDAYTMLKRMAEDKPDTISFR
jgi:hypothetical protein